MRCWKDSGLYWVLEESDHVLWLPWWVQASRWLSYSPSEFRCLVRQTRRAKRLRPETQWGRFVRRINRIAGRLFFDFAGPLCAPHLNMIGSHEVEVLFGELEMDENKVAESFVLAVSGDSGNVTLTLFAEDGHAQTERTVPASVAIQMAVSIIGLAQRSLEPPQSCLSLEL